MNQGPNQPPRRNAGSRPSSDESPASETPSSLGPRTLALLLAIVGLGFLLVACGAKKIDKSLATYSGDVAAYRGPKKLVVAFTASWASFWKLTEDELAKLDKSRFDLCILDADVDRDQVRKFGVDFLPTVALVEDGKITKRIQNLASIDQLRDW